MNPVIVRRHKRTTGIMLLASLKPSPEQYDNQQHGLPAWPAG